MNDEHLRGLLAIFERRIAGERVYSDADVRAFVPLLWIAGGAKKPTGALAELIAAFAKELALPPDATKEHAEQAVSAWLVEHPPQPELAAEVQAYLISLRTPDAKAAAALLGHAMSNVPVGARPAPPGSSKASPLARFTMDVKMERR
jgi:hypothetical protein